MGTGIFGDDAKTAVGTGGFHRIEEEIEKRLFELVVIALQAVQGSFKFARKGDFLPVELVLHEAKRVVEGFMKSDGGESWFGWTGEFQDLADQGVDAGNLPFHNGRKLGALIFLEEQVDKRFYRHKSVFDLMRHPGGKDADARQAIEAPDIQLQFFQRCQFVQDHDEFVNFLPFETRDRDVDGDRNQPSGTGRELHFAVSDVLAGTERLLDQRL